jgi:AP-2 complex subunit alpha
MSFAPVAAPAPPPAAAAAPLAAIGVSQELLPSMRTWFNGLVLTPQGVLFEDNYVQVSFRHAYQQHQARLAIYVKNKTSTPFTNTVASIPPISYVTVNTTQPLAANIAPGETGSMVVSPKH